LVSDIQEPLGFLISWTCVCTYGARITNMGNLHCSCYACFKTWRNVVKIIATSFYVIMRYSSCVLK